MAAEIDIKCSTCGKYLREDIIVGDEETVEVGACPTCTDNAASAAFAEGYQAGLEARS